MQTKTLFPFLLFDARRRRLTRARYVAEIDTVARRGEPNQILGRPEVRVVGDPATLVAGHLASSPGPSGPLPPELCDGEELVRVEVQGDSLRWREHDTWGTDGC